MSITVSEDELIALTGYKDPGCQLRELLRQGFFRARRSPRTGSVVLERAHYDAVCAGEKAATTPQVRTPTLRRAA